MKTDCIFRSKNHIKLSPLASTPSIEELGQLLVEVQKTRNCSIELPWAIDMVRFALDVRINLGATEPMWTLYQGDGYQTHTVWSAPFIDVYLLREVITLSIAEIISEHKQKLAANAKANGFNNSGTTDDANQDDLVVHSYRTSESSLAPLPNIVSQPIAKSEQVTIKNGEDIKKSEQLLEVAEQSINKAEQSINKAEQSINKAEQSINKVEHIIEEISEANALASSQSPQDKDTNTPQSPPPSYAYVYPGNTYALPIAYPVLASTMPTINAGTIPTTAPVAPPLPTTGQAAFVVPAQSSNVRASSIRLAATDIQLLDKQTKFLLGQFLVDSKIIPTKTLDVALKVQKMIGGNIISQEQAVNTINRVHFRKGSFDMVQLMRDSKSSTNKENNPDQNFPLLGELLVLSGVIDNPTLEAALKMQEVVRGGAMSKEKACEILNKDFVLSGRIKNNIDRAEQVREKKIVDLLVEAGLINQEDKKTAQDVQKKFGGKIGEILVSAHKLSDITYKAAFECDQLINQNKIKVEESIIALNYCERSRVNLTEAMQELGFQINLNN